MFYIGATILDWITYGLGMIENSNGDASYLCLNEKYLIVNSNLGAALLLIFTLVLFAYSLMMSYVFYMLPQKEGLALQNMALLE